MNVASWFLLLVVLGIGAADFWLLDRYGPTGTISNAILESCRVHPVIPFLFGLLMGHLFWPQVVKNVLNQP
jgi:hypothetical protein